jgi:drug/metabolite transporter (DMT)-like permease
MATLTAPRPQQNRLLGIGMRICAATGFALMAALIKLGYDSGIATPEMVFYRFAFGLPPLLLWMASTRNLGAWRTRRPLAHLTRAVLGLTSLSLAFSALGYLPLAEATTISFVAPLFSVILSALVLSEAVGRHRWSAVAIGFGGVVIVMQPAGTALPAVGLTLALLAAFSVAGVTITIRQISRTEPTPTIVFWFSVFSIGAAALLLPFYGRAHDLREWLILAGIGTLGGTAQIFLTSSLRFAPIAAVVPFDYVQLLWAVMLGWSLWGTHPAATSWIGAAVIVGSGLYTVYREHRLGRDKPHPPPLEG